MSRKASSHLYLCEWVTWSCTLFKNFYGLTPKLTVVETKLSMLKWYKKSMYMYVETKKMERIELSAIIFMYNLYWRSNKFASHSPLNSILFILVLFFFLLDLYCECSFTEVIVRRGRIGRRRFSRRFWHDPWEPITKRTSTCFWQLYSSQANVIQIKKNSNIIWAWLVW